MLDYITKESIIIFSNYELNDKLLVILFPNITYLTFGNNFNKKVVLSENLIILQLVIVLINHLYYLKV